LVACAAALAAAAAGARASAASPCGTISLGVGPVGGRHLYGIVVAQGHPTCADARRVLYGFLAAGRAASGWFCVRGHVSQGQHWAASCATVDGTAAVEAYPVAVAR